MLLPIIIFAVIESYLFLLVLIPYFRCDQFQAWDNIGHYFAAWFYRNYLFPWFSGWNPFFFGGYPQGTFYGPIYHYIIALLSFPFGLPLAFKLFTIFNIAILPFAIYYLARKLGFDPSESSVMTFLSMIPVCGLSLACGGTLFSQFGVGLGSHAFALPLFLFYFGKLKEQIDKLMKGEIGRVSRLNLITLTVLAVIIMLSHFVIAFAAIIAALLLVLNSFNRDVFVFAVKHGTIAVFICGFFWVPLVAYGGLTDSSGTILSMGFFLTIPCFLLIIFGGAANILDRDNRFDRTFFVLIAVFAVMAFIDFGQIGLPMHAYRFVLFFMIFAMMLPVKMLFNKIDNKPLKIFFALSFLLLAGWQFFLMIFANPRLEINYNKIYVYQKNPDAYFMDVDIPKVKGRIMLLESSPPAFPRALEHIAAQSTNNFMLKGLFSESSANAGYIFLLQNKMLGLLSSGNLSAKEAGMRSQNASRLLNLFQVNYLLGQNRIKNAKLVKEVPVRDKVSYYLYKIGSGEVVELLDYKPYCTEKNWKAAVYQWFECLDPRILARAADLPAATASPKDGVNVIEERISPPLLRLKVNAQKDVPILIKISYFPRWRAYADGKPVKIYQVAPSFMLIYGKGDIKLEYRSTLIDWAGKLLTVFGLVWIGWEGCRCSKN